MIEPIWKSYIATTAYPVLNPQQCDELIRIGQSEPQIKGKTSMNDADSQKYRKSTISWIPFTNTQAVPLYKVISQWVERINNNSFGFDTIQLTEAGQYAEYSKGGFYNWHMDSSTKMITMPPVRKISMTLLLNDPKEFEGGYLQIFCDNLLDSEKSKIKVERGYAVFFASFLLHRVTPITKGNRKSLVMWFGGTPFK